jgi:hypothetical protein
MVERVIQGQDEDDKCVFAPRSLDVCLDVDRERTGRRRSVGVREFTRDGGFLSDRERAAAARTR